MLLTPPPDAFNHNAVSAAQGYWRRHDGVGNPVNMHNGNGSLTGQNCHCPLMIAFTGPKFMDGLD